MTKVVQATFHNISNNAWTKLSNSRPISEVVLFKIAVVICVKYQQMFQHTFNADTITVSKEVMRITKNLRTTTTKKLG